MGFHIRDGRVRGAIEVHLRRGASEDRVGARERSRYRVGKTVQKFLRPRTVRRETLVIRDDLRGDNAVAHFQRRRQRAANADAQNASCACVECTKYARPQCGCVTAADNRRNVRPGTNRASRLSPVTATIMGIDTLEDVLREYHNGRSGWFPQGKNPFRTAWACEKRPQNPYNF